jgi:hypothetical protein
MLVLNMRVFILPVVGIFCGYPLGYRQIAFPKLNESFSKIKGVANYYEIDTDERQELLFKVERK